MEGQMDRPTDGLIDGWWEGGRRLGRARHMNRWTDSKMDEQRNE